MKKIKNLIITLLIIGFVLFSTSISMAASLTISTSKSEAKEGETVSITVNGSGITGRVNLSATGGTLEESSVWVENSKATVNLTLNGSGDAKVTATPSDVSDSSTGEAASVSSTGATVKLSKDEPTPPAETDSNNNNESNQQNDNEDNNNNNNDNNSSNSNNNSSNNNQTEKRNTETKKSSNANLNNLGIKPNDFTGFRAGTTSYNVTVPNDVEKVNVYATAADRNAKVTGTGDRNLNVGSNALNVTVTAEDGTTKTYTINVKREEAKIGEMIRIVSSNQVGRVVNTKQGKDGTTILVVKMGTGFTTEISVYDNPYHIVKRNCKSLPQSSLKNAQKEKPNNRSRLKENKDLTKESHRELTEIGELKVGDKIYYNKLYCTVIKKIENGKFSKLFIEYANGVRDIVSYNKLQYVKISNTSKESHRKSLPKSSHHIDDQIKKEAMVGDKIVYNSKPCIVIEKKTMMGSLRLIVKYNDGSIDNVQNDWNRYKII